MKIYVPIIGLLILVGCGKDESKQREQPGIYLTETGEAELMGEISNPLRGYVSVNNHMKNNFFENDDFDLALYLEEPLSGFEKIFSTVTLADSLGTRKGSGTREDASGKEPSAMNLMLWRLVTSNTAKEITSVCADSETAAELRAALSDAARALCDPTEWDPVLLHDYYSLLLDTGATANQFKSVSQFFLDSNDNFEQPHSLEELTIAILLSPEFLVRR